MLCKSDKPSIIIIINNVNLDAKANVKVIDYAKG